MEQEKLQIYTIAGLAKNYNISARTLYNWLLPIRQELLDMYPKPKKRLRILFPKQVRRISEFLG